MSFNPNEHLMQLKHGQTMSDYLPVQWRLVWFRELCPSGTIDTEELAYDLDREVEAEVYVWNPEKRRSEKTIKRAKGYARYRATVTDGKGGSATGTKSENAASFDDFGEKAETGAIGRALAALGYGTQFAPELNEEHRIVDSPVDRANTTENTVESRGNVQQQHPRQLNAPQRPPQAQQTAQPDETSIAIKAKLETLMPRVRALGLASTYGGLYQRIGAEIGKEVKSAADLSLALLKVYEDKVFQLELQAATDRQKAS